LVCSPPPVLHLPLSPGTDIVPGPPSSHPVPRHRTTTPWAWHKSGNSLRLNSTQIQLDSVVSSPPPNKCTLFRGFPPCPARILTHFISLSCIHSEFFSLGPKEEFSCFLVPGLLFLFFPFFLSDFAGVGSWLSFFFSFTDERLKGLLSLPGFPYLSQSGSYRAGL